MADRSVRVILTAITSQYQAAMARAKATTSGLGEQISKAGANWQKTGTTMQRVGSNFSSVGRGLTRNVSLPLAGMGALSLKTAIDFESAFTGVRKTIDATEQQYRELEDGIKSMAERLPASVEEISAVAEAAGQLGIQRQSILGFTETMIDLGESTNLTADTAATSLARLANITKMPQDQFDRLGSTIVDLGNKGASTEAEITEMALRIAGAGSTVGLTEAQILGFAESLSSVGIAADAGGSSISRTFITMAAAVEEGKDALDGFAEVAGMSAADFKKQFETDAAGATIAFIEGLGRIKKEGGDLFGTLDKLGLSEIRVRDALLRAAGAGDLFADSQKTANEAWKENNALAEESDKRYATNAAKLEILKNKFRNIAATFGNDMMPFLRDAAKALGDLAKWFNSLSKEQRENILKWGALAIAAGPFLRVLGGITSTTGGILKMAGALTQLGKASKTLPTTVPTTVPGGAGAGLLTGMSGVATIAALGAVNVKLWSDNLRDMSVAQDLARESINATSATLMDYTDNLLANDGTREELITRIDLMREGLDAEGASFGEMRDFANLAVVELGKFDALQAQMVDGINMTADAFKSLDQFAQNYSGTLDELNSKALRPGLTVVPHGGGGGGGGSGEPSIEQGKPPTKSLAGVMVGSYSNAGGRLTGGDTIIVNLGNETQRSWAASEVAKGIDAADRRAGRQRKAKVIRVA